MISKKKLHQEEMKEHKKELIEQNKETNTILQSTVECMAEFSKKIDC